MEILKVTVFARTYYMVIRHNYHFTVKIQLVNWWDFTLWNRGIGDPRVSCFPLPGQNGLVSNASVSYWTQWGGSQNRAMKSSTRGHSTRGSMCFLMTRPALQHFNPQCGAYLLSLFKAVFKAKSLKGRHRAGSFFGLMRGRTLKNEVEYHQIMFLHSIKKIKKIILWAFTIKRLTLSFIQCIGVWSDTV